ncbi:hydrolase, carbon-nitrogen family [Clostridiales bacterium oral taxon 876 str. F0540]|nr:hydrolase, carbon-nitrogen family [Clostridiales bacterium oral taxon 876 str. F0540]
MMRAALVVNKVVSDVSENMKNIIGYINKAADNNVDLVMFSETALTGFSMTDNPKEDIKLGVSIPGEETEKLCREAKKRNINLAIGVLEEDNGSLYDSAVFINRNGTIGLKYRRVSKGWRDPNQNNSIYKEGTEVLGYESDIGKVCFLICGDMNDGHLINKAKALKADILLFPFARSFYGGTVTHERWIKEEQEDYINRLKQTETKVFLVNYLDKEYFGGAFVLSSEGKLLASLELGKEGMLIYDF